MNFTTTESYANLPQIEKDMSEYSDLFKEVHGFRPRGRLMADFRAMSPAEREEALQNLYDAPLD